MSERQRDARDEGVTYGVYDHQRLTGDRSMCQDCLQRPSDFNQPCPATARRGRGDAFRVETWPADWRASTIGGDK